MYVFLNVFQKLSVILLVYQLKIHSMILVLFWVLHAFVYSKIDEKNHHKELLSFYGSITREEKV